MPGFPLSDKCAVSALVTRIAGSLSGGSPFRPGKPYRVCTGSGGQDRLIGHLGSVVTFVTSRVTAVNLRKGALGASNDAPGSLAVKAEPLGTGDARAEYRSVMHVQMQMRQG